MNKKKNSKKPIAKTGALGKAEAKARSSRASFSVSLEAELADDHNVPDEVLKFIDASGYWETLGENCVNWAAESSVSEFWRRAKGSLLEWTEEYSRTFDSALLAEPGLPDFVPKGSKRIKEKVRAELKAGRHGEIYNLREPMIPNLKDLVRTRVSCQFLDGVEFLSSKLSGLASDMGILCSHNKQGRIEGYFAQHICIESDVFFKFMGEKQPGKIICEIQIASVLATRIWDATHAVYEEARVMERDSPNDWQWQPSDPRFLSRQLGHMIHLADGLLVQLRESSKSNLGGGRE